MTDILNRSSIWPETAVRSAAAALWPMLCVAAGALTAAADQRTGAVYIAVIAAAGVGGWLSERRYRSAVAPKPDRIDNMFAVGGTTLIALCISTGCFVIGRGAAEIGPGTAAAAAAAAGLAAAGIAVYRTLYPKRRTKLRHNTAGLAAGIFSLTCVSINSEPTTLTGIGWALALIAVLLYSTIRWLGESDADALNGADGSRA